MSTLNMATSITPPNALTAPSGSSDGIGLSESDARTLRRALAVLKTCRADARSQDPTVARPASRRLLHILCYLCGYLDGKGFGTGLNPGFESVLQSSSVVVTDPEQQLDALQKSLETALQPGSTRFLLQIIGGGLIGIGILIKTLND